MAVVKSVIKSFGSTFFFLGENGFFGVCFYCSPSSFMFEMGVGYTASCTAAVAARTHAVKKRESRH